MELGTLLKTPTELGYLSKVKVEKLLKATLEMGKVFSGLNPSLQKRIMMTNGSNKNVAERLIPSILNPQSSILYETLKSLSNGPKTQVSIEPGFVK